MLPLLQAVAALGTAIAAAAIRRAVVSAMTLVLAAILLLASLGFFTLAGYRALAQAIGAVQAPLVIGGVYLVAGLVALLVIRWRR
jgi:hypothetical protein